MNNSIKIIENFYKNPEEIIAQYENYCANSTICPGLRSVQLYEINQSLYEHLKIIFCSIHNVDVNSVKFWTYFNRQTFDPLTPECLNYNLPHVDGDTNYNNEITAQNYDDKMLYGGSLFLTKNADLNIGIQFYNAKDGVFKDREELYEHVLHGYLEHRVKYQSGLIDRVQVEEHYKKYMEKFEMTADIKCVFNRLVTWKCGVLKGSRFITQKQNTRLTQNFYLTRK